MNRYYLGSVIFHLVFLIVISLFNLDRPKYITTYVEIMPVNTDKSKKIKKDKPKEKAKPEKPKKKLNKTSNKQSDKPKSKSISSNKNSSVKPRNLLFDRVDVQPKKIVKTQVVKKVESNQQIVAQESKYVFTTTSSNKNLDIKSTNFMKMVDNLDITKLESKDIMASTAIDAHEKKVLMDQISKCVTSIGMIREKTVSVQLALRLNPDSSIKYIAVVKDGKVVPKEQLSIMETRVLSSFSNEGCTKLMLPISKYETWKEFTIKLNLRGFFE